MPGPSWKLDSTLNGTLYFPAWIAPAKGGGRGVEVMGQRMIFMAVYWLTLLLALLPATLLADLQKQVGFDA